MRSLISRPARAVSALALALSAVPFLATAATQSPQPPSSTSHQRQGGSASASVSADPAFSKPDPVRLPDQPMMRAFLAEQGQTRRVNTFCFVQRRLSPPETASDGTSVLSMIWNEGERIYLVNLVRPGQTYQPVEDPQTEGRALASSSGSVNLKTDVVPTDADVGTSTSLVSRTWVDRLRTQCRRVGTVMRVQPFRAPRAP